LAQDQEIAMEACQVMTSPTITISPGASVRQATRMMLDNHVSGLPVVDEKGRLMGVLSEGDLLRRAEIGTERHRPKWLEFLLGPGRGAVDYVHSHSRRVTDLMTEDPVAVDEHASLEEVVALMEKNGIKRVPVLRDGAVVGIVTRADLLRAFVDATDEQASGTRSDADIQTDIRAALDAQKWAPEGSIHITVRDGHATISGTIFDERERDAIRVCAENVPGVKAVTDELIWIDPSSGNFLAPTV
jgi:CBS domain-containing protein